MERHTRACAPVPRERQRSEVQFALPLFHVIEATACGRTVLATRRKGDRLVLNLLTRRGARGFPPQVPEGNRPAAKESALSNALSNRPNGPEMQKAFRRKPFNSTECHWLPDLGSNQGPAD